MKKDDIILKLSPRKLIQISGSLYLALPHDWLNHYELKANEKVSLFIDNKTRLIIIPLKE